MNDRMQHRFSRYGFRIMACVSSKVELFLILLGYKGGPMRSTKLSSDR